MATRAVAVAYSGGRDSSALLHASLQAAQALSTQGEPLQIHALHVHHGLSERADAWLAHCRNECEAYAHAGLPIRFHAEQLQSAPLTGHSIEAWAREQRYAALARMAQGAGVDLVLLAHHRRDQAETWLLQALRGAGVAGLAAMPEQQWRDGICWARPWLAHPRESIEAYVREHGLAHIEDDSNLDPRFARNRLRLQVMPALQQAFDGAERQLATAATWAQQARALEVEIADEDLARLAGAAGLDVQAWQMLSQARASNALRAWLAVQSGRPAPASLVRRLMAELPQVRAGRWPLAHGELRLYRGRLSFAEAVHDRAQAAVAPATETIDISAPGRYAWPQWRGELLVTEVAQGGIALDRLRQVCLRARSGGEQFQQSVHGMPRSLKKAFQSTGVAAWDRDGPLLFASGGELLFIPDLGLDARQIAQESVPQAILAWQRSMSR